MAKSSPSKPKKRSTMPELSKEFKADLIKQFKAQLSNQAQSQPSIQVMSQPSNQGKSQLSKVKKRITPVLVGMDVPEVEPEKPFSAEMYREVIKDIGTSQASKFLGPAPEIAPKPKRKYTNWKNLYEECKKTAGNRSDVNSAKTFLLRSEIRERANKIAKYTADFAQARVLKEFQSKTFRKGLKKIIKE